MQKAGISFLEILTVFEKIVYHCLNVSIAISNFVTNTKFTTKQDYTEKIYKEHSILLKDKLNEYSIKYEGQL